MTLFVFHPEIAPVTKFRCFVFQVFQGRALTVLPLGIILQRRLGAAIALATAVGAVAARWLLGKSGRKQG